MLERISKILYRFLFVSPFHIPMEIVNTHHIMFLLVSTHLNLVITTYTTRTQSLNIFWTDFY